MAFFGKLWRGEYSLVKTFWLYGVLPNALFSIVAQAAINASNEVGTGFFLGVLYLPYYIVIVGGVWRSGNVYCATEGKNVFWGRAAQVLATLGLGAFVLSHIWMMQYI